MLEINEDNFEKEVVKNNSPVIVDFWAPRCQPCILIASVLKKISGEYKGIKFVKINIEENMNLKDKYNIMCIPCLILFQDGKERHRITGFKSEYDLRKKLNEILDK
jgi:thioredoxin 1